MERAVWTRGAMVLTIVVLVALILATPNLLGRPTPELASLPLLIIGMRNESTLIVNAGAAVQAYRYEEIRFVINGTEPWANQSFGQTDTYGEHAWAPANATLTIHVYFIDQQRNYFEYNVTVHTEKDSSNRTVMVFTFPFEEDNRTTVIRRTPPEDFRWVIPRRGRLP